MLGSLRGLALRDEDPGGDDHHPLVHDQGRLPHPGGRPGLVPIVPLLPIILAPALLPLLVSVLLPLLVPLLVCLQLPPELLYLLSVVQGAVTRRHWAHTGQGVVTRGIMGQLGRGEGEVGPASATAARRLNIHSVVSANNVNGGH